MATLKIALYSDDSSVRKSVIAALGREINQALGEHTITEFATADALRLKVDAGAAFDLFILDGSNA